MASGVSGSSSTASSLTIENINNQEQQQQLLMAKVESMLTILNCYDCSYSPPMQQLKDRAATLLMDSATAFDQKGSLEKIQEAKRTMNLFINMVNRR